MHIMNLLPIMNSMVADNVGSMPLILKPFITHDPEPIPSTSHPYNHSPQGAP
jgi:hypothetical protein